MTEGSQRPLDRVASLRLFLRPAAAVAALTGAVQLCGFATRVIVASLFGAGPEVDALVVANTLPQYVSAVFVGAVASASVPQMVERLARGDRSGAWRLLSAGLLAVVGLGAPIALVGIAFAEPAIALAAPGLDPGTLRMAASLQLFAWPTALMIAAAALLANAGNSLERFATVGMAALVGSISGLLAVAVLAPFAGVIGVGGAVMAGSAVQLLVLWKTLPVAWHWTAPWRDEAFRATVVLAAPIVLTNLVLKTQPLLERFFASELPAGAIAHLDYALRLVTVPSILIGGGLATITASTMNWAMATGGRGSLAGALATGVRVVALLVGPTICVGFAIAPDLVTVLFERGRFGPADSLAVAGLLRVYLGALPGMCLGTITSRAFYALGDTRTLARGAILESFGYLVYAAALSAAFGAEGIAASYVLFYAVSVTWQSAILVRRVPGLLSSELAASLWRSGVSAAVAGAGAFAAVGTVTAPELRLATGILVGATLWVAGVRITRSVEGEALMGSLFSALRLRARTGDD